MRRITLLLIAFLFFQQANSQQLHGKVVDSETGEPLLFASVFFNGTTTGAITDSEGKFNIFGFDPGSYDLVVTYVGYRDFVEPLEMEDGEVRELIVEMNQDEVVLPDFYFNSDTSGWKYNYEVFWRDFIGTTNNATRVSIKEPHKIFLYYDVPENTLYAHSKEWIEIENRSLGYHLSYSLKEFSINFKTGQRYSFGITRFREMEPKNKREKAKWEKARLRAYNGSIHHFFAALKSDKLEENGFLLEELFRIPNPDRLPDSVINENILKYRAQAREAFRRKKENSQIVIGSASSTGVSLSQLNADSLGYWVNMRSQPKLLDSLGQLIKKKEYLFPNQEEWLEYKGMLTVVYLEEGEELGYTMVTRRPKEPTQGSVIHFNDDRLMVYDNGYYERVQSIFSEGYLAWASKIAELLPLDYRPPNPPGENR